MAKKYFVTSDIHGFYDEFISALKKAKFDIKNSNHILIVCGDIFDRGKKPLDVYNFLKSLPKERRILIRGNHEFLLRNLVNSRSFTSVDIHNGTLETLACIAKKKPFLEYKATDYFDDVLSDTPIEQSDYFNSLYSNDKVREILNWISEDWVNYYELTNYIFVHSWIPKKSNAFSKEVMFGRACVETKYDKDWRERPLEYWEEATWGCPWKDYLRGLNKTGKVIVCGHWHTSDFWNNLVYTNDKDKQLDIYEHNPIFRKEGINLIGLDACTAVTRGVNILTISESELKLEFYDHDKKEVAYE